MTHDTNPSYYTYDHPGPSTRTHRKHGRQGDSERAFDTPPVFHIITEPRAADVTAGAHRVTVTVQKHNNRAHVQKPD
jgi:hypothetical protein